MKLKLQLPFLILALSLMSCATTSPLPEQEADIGYPSPEAALAALRKMPGVTVREENDWYVAEEKESATLWSITRPTHPAHPSAVKRFFVPRDGVMYLSMRVMCGNTKSKCDYLVRQFKQLNTDMTKAIQSKQP